MTKRAILWLALAVFVLYLFQLNVIVWLISVPLAFAFAEVVRKRDK